MGNAYDGHPPFHRKTFNCRSAVLNHSTSTASGANLANSVQDNVFAAHTRSKLSIDLDSHILAPLRDEGLCREHMLDF